MALTAEQKAAIRQETGWSDRVLDYIETPEQARIFINARLKESVVGGRTALVRTDIDWNEYSCRHEWLKEKLSDWDSWQDYNNADLVGEGYPPRDKNGDPYELHHIGQHQDSPLAELTWQEHMGDGNNTILHKMGKESEIDRQQFKRESSQYWQARYQTIE